MGFFFAARALRAALVEALTSIVTRRLEVFLDFFFPADVFFPTGFFAFSVLEGSAASSSSTSSPR